MSIVHDDCDERQARVDRMIDEFREAQTRRARTLNDKAVESTSDAKTTAPLTGSAASQCGVSPVSRESRVRTRLRPQRRVEEP